MPSKRSTRWLGNRNAAVGLIAACIIGPAILIAARSSDTTSEAPATAAPRVAKQEPVAAPKARPASATVKTTVVAAKVAAKPQDADAAKEAEPVTIEGCLVQDDETFRLKDTTGEDAPKGRSWKSFGLHKGSKTLDVVDARHRLNLAGHVGERVTVSGMLLDKELQGSSLKKVADSCK